MNTKILRAERIAQITSGIVNVIKNGLEVSREKLIFSIMQDWGLCRKTAVEYLQMAIFNLSVKVEKGIIKEVEIEKDIENPEQVLSLPEEPKA
jgi:hypothetical protein